MSAPRHVLTILAVRDLERSVAFYRAAFGWPARVEVPAYVEFELPGGFNGTQIFIQFSFSPLQNQTVYIRPEYFLIFFG